MFCTPDILIMNNFVDYSNNLIVSCKEEAQAALDILSQCNCCQRHQQHKPVVLAKWIELPISYRIPDEFPECHCDCRHTARFICRRWASEPENSNNHTMVALAGKANFTHCVAAHDDDDMGGEDNLIGNSASNKHIDTEIGRAHV